MSLKSLLKRSHILLVLFFVVSGLYGYGIVIEHTDLIYYLKPFIVPLLAAQYIVATRKINPLFLLALLFSFGGDIFFNLSGDTFYMLAIGSFLVFNLLMIIIVAEKAGEIKFSNLLLVMVPFVIIFITVMSLLFNDAGILKVLFVINGLVLVVLCTVCLYFYIKNKSKASLLFLIGSLFFAAAAISKAYKDFDLSTTVVKIVNTSCYALSLFFYYYAMITKTAKVDNSDLQETPSFLLNFDDE